MKLNVLNRLLLLNLLPKEGDITTLRIIRKLQEELSFSEEEHKALNFTEDGTALNWTSSADVPKEVSIGVKASAIIVDVLEKRNAEKKLTAEFLPLYDLFIPVET